MDFIISFLFIIVLAVLVGYVIPAIQKKMPEPKWQQERRRSDENEERRKKILARWEKKFPPPDPEWQTYHTYEKEDLVFKYDRIFNQFEHKQEYLSRISVENPEKVRILEGEIEHYGDTIDENDNEYISRVDEIRRLRREIPTVELELRDIKISLNAIENEIKIYDQEEYRKNQDYYKKLSDGEKETK